MIITITTWPAVIAIRATRTAGRRNAGPRPTGGLSVGSGSIEGESGRVGP